MARKADGGVDALASLAANASAARRRNASVTTAKKASPKRKGTVLSISMSLDDAEFVRKAAASHGIPLSAYVRLACHEFERQHR